MAARPLDGLLPIRQILIDGEETPFLRDLDFSSASFDLTVDGAAGKLSIAIASDFAVDQLQGAAILIGTEVSNATIDIGNGADTITLSANDITLGADNILSLAAPAVRLGGAAASDRLTVSGTTGIVTIDAADGTIINLRTDTFGIYEAAQPFPSFTFSCDADAASSLTFGSGTTVSILQSQSLSGAGRTLTIRGQQGQAGQVGGNLELGSGLGGTAGTNAPGNIKLRVGAQAGGQTGHVLLTDESSGDTDFLRMRRVGTATYLESIAGDLNLSATAAAQVIATTTMVFRGTGCYFDANTLYTRTNALTLKETTTVADVFDRNYASGVYPQWSINGNMRMRYNASGFYVASPNSFNSFEVQDAGISLSHAYGYVDITGGGSPGVTLNTTDSTAAISSANSALLRRSIGGRIYRREFVYTVQTTNATPVYLTYTTTAGTGYRVQLEVQVSNDTDNEFGSFAMKEAAYKNIGGTLTNVGGADKVGADYIDAGTTAANTAINTSGTAIRAELTGIAGKALNWNVVLRFYERVIA